MAPERIHTLFRALETDLDQLEAELSGYSAEDLRRAAPNGGWSAIQCLEHLRMAERQSHAYLEKKLSFNPSLPKTDWNHAIRRHLLKNYMNIPIKLKAPKGIGIDQPANDVAPADLFKQWRAQRRSLEDYLKGLNPDLFTRQVFKHPVAGRVSLEAMLQFFRAHFTRHRRQALRTLAANQA